MVYKMHCNVLILMLFVSSNFVTSLAKNSDDSSMDLKYFSKRSSVDRDSGYDYEENSYREKTGGYGGSDVYSNKAGYGGGNGGGYGGGGGGYGGGGGGDGGIIQVITSLGVLLSLLLAGLALGAAMFGPFTNANTGTTIPTVTVPPMMRRFHSHEYSDSQAGMGASTEMLQKTRSKFLDTLEAIFKKYDIKESDCQKKFVCHMYSKLKEMSNNQNVLSEPEITNYDIDSDKSSLLSAAMNGSSGFDCSSFYSSCQDDLSFKLKQWKNDLN